MSHDSLVIDAQVHAYQRNHAARPWVGHLHGPDEVTGDDMVAAMDAVGVDGALLISPWSLYRFDASYALEVHARHGDRFGLIKPFDPASPAIEEEIAQWARTPGAVGARIVLWHDHVIDEKDPGLSRILKAGARHALPINILAWERLDLFATLARAHPDTQLVLDHCGLRQAFTPPPPAAPFAALDEVLALARLDNVVIKITGACTLSHQPYPYADIHAPLKRLFDAYGFERCLWGTDWTRATAFVTYAQGVDMFRDALGLSSSERAALMGGSLTRVYRWAPRR
ncbi:MAG: amidohydrolase family protein [Proteobacteria bacterium]|jgi:L-fuconolactonase|nr:amidohydrolase family protein [Pseudomonadota bacterium]